MFDLTTLDDNVQKSGELLLPSIDQTVFKLARSFIQDMNGISLLAIDQSVASAALEVRRPSLDTCMLFRFKMFI